MQMNRHRLEIVAKWMFGLASLSTVTTIIAFILFNDSKCQYMTPNVNIHTNTDLPCYYNHYLIGTGIWGPAFSWPAAITALLASKKNSKCLLVAHLTLVILAVLLTISGFIVETILLSRDWLNTDGWHGVPNEYAKGVISMLFISTFSLLALCILSLCSSAFSCQYLCTSCCSYGETPVEPDHIVPGQSNQRRNRLLGVQFIEQGNVMYYPFGSPEVSEVVTENGRIIVVSAIEGLVGASRELTPPPTYNSTNTEKELEAANKSPM